MKNFSAKFIKVYFSSFWLPVVVMLCMLLILVALTIVNGMISYSRMLKLLKIGVFLLFVLASIGIPIAAIWNLIRKRWLKGLVNILVTVLELVPLVLFFLMIYSFLGPSEDGFADELSIPPNIQTSEPLEQERKSQGAPEDTFQARLLSVLKQPGNQNTSVKAESPSLVQLREDAPEILRRYLATSPAWRVFREKGSLYATRRWMIGSDWRYNMHGYYSRFDLGFSLNGNIPDFQTRLTIGFSGKPWARLSGESTRMENGQVKNLLISGNNRVLSSHCVISENELVIEVFEQSEAKERRLTKASLLHIEEELKPLTAAPEFSTVQSILPPGSVRYGQPTIELHKSFQPGIYDSEIWANPGEPGMIYLKAYEVTHETSLSAASLKKYSNEWIGWSDDASQLFFSNTHFTIYEGDWGKPYAARFEVWFVPDSGGAERKLIERLFTIEGWQR